MIAPVRTALVPGVALCVFAPQLGNAECAYDFVADFDIQVSTEAGKAPRDNNPNRATGSAWVREEELMDIELWSYKVDLRFRDLGEHRYEVTVVLQERTDGFDSPQMAGVDNPGSTYEQIYPAALTYEGTYGSPMAIRPTIGGVTLDLALYANAKESQGHINLPEKLWSL